MLKVGPKPIKAWTWPQFNALPQTKMTRDIHCVTTWSKLDTAWQGVLVDDILADAGLEPRPAFCSHMTIIPQTCRSRMRRFGKWLCDAGEGNHLSP
jgi:hypothetical protein